MGVLYTKPAVSLYICIDKDTMLSRLLFVRYLGLGLFFLAAHKGQW